MDLGSGAKKIGPAENKEPEGQDPGMQLSDRHTPVLAVRAFVQEPLLAIHLSQSKNKT